MKGFVIKTKDDLCIRFNYYLQDAPVTCTAFANILPFTLTLLHARVSGQEIWAGNAHELDIIQENASVFTQPGEIVLGPVNPLRAKTSKCMGIYYGEGRGLDCCNIFGKAFEEDMHLLAALGDAIWQHGAHEVTFEVID